MGQNLLAIDPGLKGGYAIFNTITQLVDSGRLPHYKWTINHTAKAHRHVALETLRDTIERYDIGTLVVEVPRAMPGQSSVATATTFRNWGEILGLRLFCPIHVVDARTWKKALGLDADKKAAIAKARRMFPDLPGKLIRDGEAEAILIGFYWLTKGAEIARLVASPPRNQSLAARNARWQRLLAHADSVIAVQQSSWLKPSPLDRELPELAEAIERRLQPVTPLEAHTALAQVVGLMGCRRPDPALCEGYVMVMVQFPRDLLERSLVACLSVQTYHKLPTPGALCKLAQQETEARRNKLSRVRLAISRLEFAERLRKRASSSSAPSAPPPPAGRGRT